jgi:two-component system OmpR family response regulator
MMAVRRVSTVHPASNYLLDGAARHRKQHMSIEVHNLTKQLKGQSVARDVVIADNDPILRRVIAKYLEEHGMSVRYACNRNEIYRLLTMDPRLIILDPLVHREDGFGLLRDICSHSDVPVIVTTSDRPDEHDRIVCLELGADDYIVKPFSLRELLARIRAVLRRQEMGPAARAKSDQRGGYRFSGWRLDLGTRRLVDINETQVRLSNKEHALLLAFLQAPQRLLTRDYLLQETALQDDLFDRSIDVLVSRLRRKLAVDPTIRSVIRTERGVGYLFASKVETF